MAMQLMGEQFVTGENIGAALKRARKVKAKGSYPRDTLNLMKKAV